MSVRVRKVRDSQRRRRYPHGFAATSKNKKNERCVRSQPTIITLHEIKQRGKNKVERSELLNFKNLQLQKNAAAGA
jgi:hypothetical protein